MEYGKLVNGTVEYWINSKVVYNNKIYANPTDDILAKVGIYPVIDIEADGENCIENNKIKHYIGKPYTLSKQELYENAINEQLSDTTELIKALERIVAEYGVTEDDKDLAKNRIALRDSIGKIIQTDEGDGSDMNPFTWTAGHGVIKDMWYKTPSGYIWEAIATGIPSSETDTEYFDVVGIETPTQEPEKTEPVVEVINKETTNEENGTYTNPFIYKPGMAVGEGMWYKMSDDNIWEAIASGTPSSESDTNFFDIII